jgi:hypothetical protein
LFEQLDSEERVVLERLKQVSGRPSGEPAVPVTAPVRGTSVAVKAGRWYVDGEITYPRSKAEGLLMNVRMVNSVFEDSGRPDFDPEANADEFIARVPEYVAAGVRAFTLNLQGGMPGYEGAANSAFEPDGSLKHSYMKRVRRVVAAFDRSRAVVILGCFYQRQDQILRDETAVRQGLLNVAKWIKTSGFGNILIEVANEFDHPGFDHPLLRTPQGQVELLRLVKDRFPCLLVSTSGLGHGRLPDEVAEASDFLLIHFNSTPTAEIPDRIARLKRFGKPIVCNEDDKVGVEAAAAAETSVENGASWGFMLKEVNQTFPFRFDGTRDDAPVYEKIKELTHPAGAPRE